MTTGQPLCVLIATLATAERAPYLRRAALSGVPLPGADGHPIAEIVARIRGAASVA
jgi:hypothetical protein